MSNPYDGSSGPANEREPGEPPSLYPPYQGNPYAAPGSSPYGGGGYGATPSGPAGPGVDPVSITGFVLSLLCCTSLFGLILGIVGLSRTKNGARGGRWAAIAAITIGAIGTLAGAVLLVFFVWFGTSTVSTGSADVGQCVDVDDFSGSNDATLFKKDCDEDHDAEVVAIGEFDEEQVDAFDEGNSVAVCAPLLDDAYTNVFQSGDYDLDIVFESIEPATGDEFLCYLENADGSKLDAPLVD